MSKFKTEGEYIPLHWEYTEPDVEYVAGHVTADGFRTALAAYHGDQCTISDADGARLRQTFARWVPTPHGDSDFVLQESREKKRGCFAVTALDTKRR